MAEGKKGFVLYADQKSIFDDLTNEEAGILIKHIFSYVNDENPTLEDRLIDMAFKPIKAQLKRDLVKYQSIKEKNSLNARKRWDAVASGGMPLDAKNADKDKDNVTDTVNVIVKDKVKVRSKTIFVAPLILEVEIYFKEKGYTKEAALKFFDYYSVADWKDSKGTEVKNWKQKAQSVWFKPENKIKENIKSTDLTQTPLPK